jgi:membrane protein involved in colicin uptake
MRILGHSQQSQAEMTQSHDKLERQWNELTESYHKHQERIRELEEELKRSIRKDEAERLKDLNEKLYTELTETRAAMLSYKNMTEVIGDQVKGLKLTMERKKDENDNLINALRDLQSMSEDNQRVGKLYYLIMLSRWQEAAVNKKYDMILTETKELRKELMNSE